jgi:hypothetical protein
MQKKHVLEVSAAEKRRVSELLTLCEAAKKNADEAAGPSSQDIAKYEEEQRRLKTERVEKIACCCALARAQIAEWALVSANAPDFDKLFGSTEDKRLRICFDLDVRTDALVVTRIQVEPDDDDDGDVQKSLAWDEYGEASPRDWSEILLSEEVEVTKDEYERLGNPTTCYSIPDFPKLLSDRRSALYRYARACFAQWRCARWITCSWTSGSRRTILHIWREYTNSSRRRSAARLACSPLTPSSSESRIFPTTGAFVFASFCVMALRR